MKYLEFWNQKIYETDSGKTWRTTIRKANYDSRISLNKALLNEALKKEGRILEIKVMNLDLTFRVPAWEFLINSCGTYIRETHYKGAEDMVFYWYKIPWKFLKKVKRAEDRPKEHKQYKVSEATKNKWEELRKKLKGSQ